MKNFVRVLLYALAGGISFWAPDVTLHAIAPDRPFLFFSPLMLAILYLVYRIFLAQKREVESAPSVAAFMLVGVWLLGSTAMMISASFSGGGFASPEPLLTCYAIVLGLLPPYTYIMSGYDGSMLALIATLILMPWMHFKHERKHWVIPAIVVPTRMRGVINEQLPGLLSH